MPTLKIYPPSRLPDNDVTETQFNMWQEELEVYLSQEPDFKVFLPNKLYNTWRSAEEYPDRIDALKGEDRVVVNRDENVGPIVTLEQATARNDVKIDNIRTSLRTVLAIVGKCVSEGHYNSVVRHSTSLRWIYNMLRSDYNLQSKGVHFFNILDAKYDSNKTNPIAFYNSYRTIISNNLAKTGDTIKYKNNEVLANDEKFSPMLEDIILLDVIKEIDIRLPAFIKSHYFHKMKRDEHLMDFKTDILINVPHFLELLDNSETSSLNAFKPTQYSRQSRKAKKAAPQPKYYCRFCFLSQKPREVYTSHNFGDPRYCSLSPQDRKMFMETAHLSNIKEEEPEVDDEELAEMYGYGSNVNDSEDVLDQVNLEKSKHNSSNNLSRNDEVKCSYIQPVPSQVLTVFQDPLNKTPFYIDLDSGATCNFIRECEARKFKFKIHPNSQVSKLGDGVTKLKGIGEIRQTFFRNNLPITFNAVVCKELTSPVIGGTPFIKENGVEQDLVRNVIHLNNRQVTVQATDPASLLPTAPIITTSLKVTKKTSSQSLSLKSFKSRVLLPGQNVEVDVDCAEDSLMSIEPSESNENADWPEAHLQNVVNGKITLSNSKAEPIVLGKAVKSCNLRETEDPEEPDPSYYQY